MACQDCYCGRKEMEAAGRQFEEKCGPGPIDQIVDSYENGEIDKATFINALESAIGSK